MCWSKRGDADVSARCHVVSHVVSHVVVSHVRCEMYPLVLAPPQDYGDQRFRDTVGGQLLDPGPFFRDWGAMLTGGTASERKQGGKAGWCVCAMCAMCAMCVMCVCV
jgi:hypothetical protein